MLDGFKTPPPQSARIQQQQQQQQFKSTALVYGEQT
jgi:hypothetical protein